MLPRLVGITRAADLLLSGRVFTGAETAEWGLWNQVLPDGGSTLDAAREYAHRLVSTAAPTAVTTTKRQIHEDQTHGDVGASVERSKELLDPAMRTAEYREGVAALREKRPPRFDTL
jgi:enoyl-CoA hydratase/carnithine racemase